MESESKEDSSSEEMVETGSQDDSPEEMRHEAEGHVGSCKDMSIGSHALCRLPGRHAH